MRLLSINPANCHTKSREGSTLIHLLVSCWLIAVTGGTWLVWRHALTPGAVGPTKVLWPDDSPLQRSTSCLTLVMTAHPLCPCTRASLNELAVLMARCDGRLKAYVLVVGPAGMNLPVQSSDLSKSAAQIPGVTAVADPDAKLSQLFGAKTSGQVFVYDRDGELQFNGGITAARGHEGDNDGLSAIVAIVHSQKPLTCSTPAFGCAIR